MPTITYKPWANLEKHVGQAYVHASTADIRVVMAGRQSGKTITGIAEISDWALSKSDQILWWVAPNYKVKDKPWRDLKAHIPKDLYSTNETELRMTLKNGSIIWIKSADAPDSLVSERLDGLVGDEGGQWKSTVWYMGLMPMFNTTKMRALFIGTPRGRNWFYELWMRGRPQGQFSDKPVVIEEIIPGPDGEDQRVQMTYQSFHWTSYDSPYRNLSVLSEARRSSPQDLFAQEWLAEPIENAQGVFRGVRQRVKAAFMAPSQTNFLGVDLARKHDFSAFALMNTNREVFHIERSQADWPVQKQRIAYLAFKHNAKVIIDATGLGDPIAQDLRSSGLQVEEMILSNEGKRNIIDALRLGFESGSLTIPSDDDLLDELEAYEYEVLPMGGLRYSAPEGKHDDMVIALALANWGARSIPLGYSNQSVTHRYLPRTRGGLAVNL